MSISSLPTLPSILAPLHLLSYSTLLGTSLYHSFVIIPASHAALPKFAFTTLAKRLFPAYFRTQSFLFVLTALSYPPHGIVGLGRVRGDWITLVVIGVGVGLNLCVYEPRTRRAMIERIHQETRDAQANGEFTRGNNASDGGEKDTKGMGEEMSEEMRKKNRTFHRDHQMCIHFNVVTVLGVLWYGVRLAWRLDVQS